MDIAQLLITIGAVVGVVLIGVLAIVPWLLERPAGRDHPDPDTPTPTTRPRQNGVDLAA